MAPRQDVVELRNQVQKAVDAIAADLNSAQMFDPDALAATIQSKVKAAIRAEQEFLEDIWSFLDKDDFIGSMVWYALYGELERASAPLVFSESWGAPLPNGSLTVRRERSQKLVHALAARP